MCTADSASLRDEAVAPAFLKSGREGSIILFCKIVLSEMDFVPFPIFSKKYIFLLQNNVLTLNPDFTYTGDMAYRGKGAAPFPMSGKWAFDGIGKIKMDATPPEGMNQDGLPGRCPRKLQKGFVRGDGISTD